MSAPLVIDILSIYNECSSWCIYRGSHMGALFVADIEPLT